MINTSGGPLTITGISQGSYGSYTGTAGYNIYYYPGSYVPQIGNPTGLVQVATMQVLQFQQEVLQQFLYILV